MHLLDEDKSWDLFCHMVFSQEHVPDEYRELEVIGRKIAQNCRGLPLSMRVIGGLLANSSKTRDFWEYVARNVNSVAIESDEHCSEILSLSYNNLPDQLKPCFLYFGAFPEDYEISITKLINLWIADGFLKPVRSKMLEAIVEECLNGLINRNLVFVHRKGSNGKPKTCSIHDLLRDLCLKEAQKENFLRVINSSVRHLSSDDTDRAPRLLSIHRDILNNEADNMYCTIDQSMIFTRALLCTGSIPCTLAFCQTFIVLRVLDFLQTSFSEFPIEILSLVALRYLAFSFDSFPILPSPAMALLRKLQFLIIRDRQNLLNRQIFPYYESYCPVDLPMEILQMAKLRHLQMTECILPDSIGENDSVILKELRTLSTVANFKCTDGVLEKFPNLRKLSIYFYTKEIYDWSDYHLQNLARMIKLENLKCVFNCPPTVYLLPNLIFPQSLKKLTLSGSNLFWKDMTIIGTLPHLEVLKLKEYAFVGPIWESTEGEFCRLKFLQIERTNLIRWIAESTHFPCLNHLIIEMCRDLQEIPSGIGDIATLERIVIDNSSDSLVASAEKILEEQRSMENHVLQVSHRFDW